jgi:hypothetical protein
MNSVFSPEVVRPFPTADLNQSLTKRGGRRKRRSSILTTTPEKLALEGVAKRQRTKEKNKGVVKRNKFLLLKGKYSAKTIVHQT